MRSPSTKNFSMRKAALIKVTIPSASDTSATRMLMLLVSGRGFPALSPAAPKRRRFAAAASASSARPPWRTDRRATPARASGNASPFQSTDEAVRAAGHLSSFALPCPHDTPRRMLTSWSVSPGQSPLLCAGAAAQPPQAPPEAYRTAGAMAPILVFRQEPEYSEEARAAKLQGTVL